MTAPEPPVYWSPTKGVLQVSATGFGYSQLAGHTSVRELPSDAVRLVPAAGAVPAAAPTPADEVEIEGDDLSAILFPAPGQLVNENPAGVVLRHAPTGIEVSCSSERTALQNKVKALAELRAVLARRTEETRAAVAAPETTEETHA